jgi:uncharacterized protein (DUF169 family)
MSDIYSENLGWSETLRGTLALGTEPVAIKLVRDASELPENAENPFRDWGRHLALCQVFALVRRRKMTIYADKQSEWCWNPLVAFGLVPCEIGSEPFEIISGVIGISDRDAARRFFAEFPRLETGEYSGILCAPLGGCGFEPDVTLVYCDDNARLRAAVLAVKNATGKLISTKLDAIDSCAYACVAVIKDGEYRVTLPDIGEHERAAAGASEAILSVPGGKLSELCGSLIAAGNMGMGYGGLTRELPCDFPRPGFYNDLFRNWGLSEGEEWRRRG